MIRVLSWVLLTFTCGGCVRWTPPAMAPPQSDSAPCRAGAVTWLAPDDPAEHRRLDAWCEGVGAPVITGPAPPSLSKPVGIEDITFVSWNVHVGNGNIEAFVRDLRAGLHGRKRPVEHFVLMLQEAVRSTGVPPLRSVASGAARIRSSGRGASADIDTLSQQLGLSLIYVPSMRNGRSAADPAADRGNAILSTLPLSNPSAAELPGERQRRVAVFAKAGTVSVGVIHLDALGAPARLWVFWTPWMRARQVRAISRVLPDGPLVIGADLNTWHGIDESAARILEEIPGATPVEPVRHGLGLRVLDYLFFRAGPDRRAHYRQLNDAYGSDHKPLIGWIE
jgi:endonuclease/exonuclease/phosphatase family metal-dependent hydrolase